MNLNTLKTTKILLDPIYSKISKSSRIYCRWQRIKKCQEHESMLSTGFTGFVNGEMIGMINYSLWLFKIWTSTMILKVTMR